MCGIIGLAGQQLQEYRQKKAPAAMLSTLAKRGPDDRGLVDFPECILGQTRLSIIDIAGGHQPMRDNQKDICITFNGEIYNYRELKDELIKRGHIFSTRSDTEVILKAYLEYGFECPRHLDGMFAFAVWDDSKKALFMARDRFGKKPFYYAFDQFDNLIFASEIKALFASGNIKGQIDCEAIDNYLSLLYIPPRKTAYKNTHILKPGHYAVFANGRIVTKQYWTLDYRPVEIDQKNAEEQLMHLLQNAVKKRMVADVEIGTFLSGGIDSSIVTYLAQMYSDKSVKTFSAGFEDYINELPFAKEAASAFGTDHHTLQIKGESLVDDLLNVSAYFDEPFADSSNIPTFLISQFARGKVKVVLSGDGADELFLGYGWYRRIWRGRWHRRVLRQLYSDPLKEYARAIQYFDEAERRALWRDDRPVNSDFLDFVDESVKSDSMERINMFDLTMYLPGDILTKVDRSSMMTSLEVRSPFLDHQLAEFVYNLPLEYKTDKREGKLILRSIFQDKLPARILERKKHGFGAPVQDWLQRSDFKELVTDTLVAPSSTIYNFFNREHVRKMIDEFYLKGRRNCGYKIWTLLCLELWLKANGKYHA